MSILRAERRETVLTLTLNRPDKRNALSSELVEAMLEAVGEAHRIPTDLVVFRGEGQAFSAGFDLSGLQDQSDGDLLHRFVRIEQLLHAVHAAPFATLALAHGRVFGAGADLVCACSHRVAAADTRFRFPGLAFGLVLGTRRLAARVGVDAARMIQAGGRTVDAEEARRIGLVTALADTGAWDDVVTATAREARAATAEARAVFHRVLATNRPDSDLAEMVRSAAIPGFAERIRQYTTEGAR